MGGKGRWVDNVFVERLWKSVKYEEVRLHAYDTVSQAREGLQRYFKFYNERRPIHRLTARPPIACTSIRCPFNRQPKPQKPT
ncbi:hypothetical protein EVC37_04985 [Methylocaldum sp. BRCS4]|jgi:putative transposase|nr:hypothetical protein [Methylocaldum sp. BRCS4]